MPRMIDSYRHTQEATESEYDQWLEQRERNQKMVQDRIDARNEPPSMGPAEPGPYRGSTVQGKEGETLAVPHPDLSPEDDREAWEKAPEIAWQGLTEVALGAARGVGSLPSNLARLIGTEEANQFADQFEELLDLDPEDESGLHAVSRAVAQVLVPWRMLNKAGAAAAASPAAAKLGVKQAAKKKTTGRRKIEDLEANKNIKRSLVESIGSWTSLTVANYVFLNPDESQPLVDMLGAALADWTNKHPSEIIPLWNYIDGKAPEQYEQELEQRNQNVLTEYAASTAVAGTAAAFKLGAGAVGVGAAALLILNKTAREIAKNGRSRQALEEAFEKHSKPVSGAEFESNVLKSEPLTDVQNRRLQTNADTIVPQVDDVQAAKLGDVTLYRQTAKGAEDGPVDVSGAEFRHLDEIGEGRVDPDDLDDLATEGVEVGMAHARIMKLDPEHPSSSFLRRAQGSSTVRHRDRVRPVHNAQSELIRGFAHLVADEADEAVVSMNAFGIFRDTIRAATPERHADIPDNQLDIGTVLHWIAGSNKVSVLNDATKLSKVRGSVRNYVKQATGKTPSMDNIEQWAPFAAQVFRTLNRMAAHADSSGLINKDSLLFSKQGGDVVSPAEQADILRKGLTGSAKIKDTRAALEVLGLGRADDALATVRSRRNQGLELSETLPGSLKIKWLAATTDEIEDTAAWLRQEPDAETAFEEAASLHAIAREAGTWLKGIAEFDTSQLPQSFLFNMDQLTNTRAVRFAMDDARKHVTNTWRYKAVQKGGKTTYVDREDMFHRRLLDELADSDVMIDRLDKTLSKLADSGAVSRKQVDRWVTQLADVRERVWENIMMAHTTGHLRALAFKITDGTPGLSDFYNFARGMSWTDGMRKLISAQRLERQARIIGGESIDWYRLDYFKPHVADPEKGIRNMLDKASRLRDEADEAFRNGRLGMDEEQFAFQRDALMRKAERIRERRDAVELELDVAKKKLAATSDELVAARSRLSTRVGELPGDRASASVEGKLAALGKKVSDTAGAIGKASRKIQEVEDALRTASRSKAIRLSYQLRGLRNRRTKLERTLRESQEELRLRREDMYDAETMQARGVVDSKGKQVLKLKEKIEKLETEERTFHNRIARADEQVAFMDQMGIPVDSMSNRLKALHFIRQQGGQGYANFTGLSKSAAWIKQAKSSQEIGLFASERMAKGTGGTVADGWVSLILADPATHVRNIMSNVLAITETGFSQRIGRRLRGGGGTERARIENAVNRAATNIAMRNWWAAVGAHFWDLFGKGKVGTAIGAPGRAVAKADQMDSVTRMLYGPNGLDEGAHKVEAVANRRQRRLQNMKKGSLDEDAVAEAAGYMSRAVDMLAGGVIGGVSRMLSREDSIMKAYATTKARYRYAIRARLDDVMLSGDTEGQQALSSLARRIENTDTLTDDFLGHQPELDMMLGISDGMIDDAAVEGAARMSGRSMTFTDPSAAAVGAVVRAREFVGPAGVPIIPFVNAIARISSYVGHFAPGAHWFNKNISDAIARGGPEADLAVGRMAVGGMWFAGGLSLWAAGSLIATGPDKRGNRDLRLAIDGRYSITGEQVSISLDGIEPAITKWLMLGVLAGEAYQDFDISDRDWELIATGLVSRLAGELEDMAFFGDATRFMGILNANDPAQALASLGEKVTQPVMQPGGQAYNLARKIFNDYKPYIHAHSESSVGRTLGRIWRRSHWRGALAATGAVEPLPILYDELGRPVETNLGSGPGTRLLWGVLPIKVKSMVGATPEETRAIKALRFLRDLGMPLSMPSDKVNYRNFDPQVQGSAASVVMTEEEYSEYTRLRGEFIKTDLASAWKDYQDSLARGEDWDRETWQLEMADIIRDANRDALDDMPDDMYNAIESRAEAAQLELEKYREEFITSEPWKR